MTDFARLVLTADTGGLRRGKGELTDLKNEAGRTARGVDRSSASMAGSFKKLAAAAAATGIGFALAQFGRSSAQAAIDAEEMESAFDVVFGNMSEDVREWARVTGDALGRSTQEMQRGALAFQELFGRALAPAQAAELSKEFALLTQDLASFKNLSNEVAQQKLFSGLVGEAEPLRAVGVFLNEAAVKAKATELGLVGVNNALTDQEKIVARAALIQEQLAQASGDVERTSDSAANQIKEYEGAVEELQIAIGQKLLPTLAPFIAGTADVTAEAARAAEQFNVTQSGLRQLMGYVATAVGGWVAYRVALYASSAATTFLSSRLALHAAAVGAATGQIGLLTSAQIAATTASRALATALLANPATTVAVGIGVLTAAMIGLGDAQRRAKAETDGLIGSLRALAQARASDYDLRRFEVERHRDALQSELTNVRAELARIQDNPFLSQTSGASGRIKALEAQARDLAWQVVELNGELDASDYAFRKAESAASSMVPPVNSAAVGVGKLTDELKKSGPAAKSATEQYSDLIEALFPENITRRQVAMLDMIDKFADRIPNVEKARRRALGIDDEAELSPFLSGPLAEVAKVQESSGMLGKTLEELEEKAKDKTVRIARSFADMATSALSSLQSLINGIKSGNFLSILSSVIGLLGQFNFFGDEPGGGLLSSFGRIFGGFRANGGPVSAGKTYVVGERGPELFTAPSAGRIVANDNIGGMTINVDARGSNDPEAVRRQVEQGILEAAPALVAASQGQTIRTLRRPRLGGAIR